MSGRKETKGINQFNVTFYSLLISAKFLFMV